MQLAQARQRSAISAQRGLPAASTSRAGNPTVGTGSPISARAAATAARASSCCVVGRRPEGEPLDQSLARRRAGPDDEPVVELGQRQVEAVRDLGTGAHRGAEAGARGRLALNGDDQRGRPPRHVVAVDRRAGREDGVLRSEGRDLAAAHPEVGDERGIRYRVLEVGLAGDPTADGERDTRREGLVLPGRRADREVEQAVGARRLQPVRPGRLGRGPARGQVGDRDDLVVHDGALADRRADDPAAVGMEHLQQATELRARQERWRHGRGHHGSSPCCANRSSSCMRVALRRCATASSSER